MLGRKFCLSGGNKGLLSKCRSFAFLLVGGKIMNYLFLFSVCWGEGGGLNDTGVLETPAATYPAISLVFMLYLPRTTLPETFAIIPSLPPKLLGFSLLKPSFFGFFFFYFPMVLFLFFSSSAACPALTLLRLSLVSPVHTP